MYQVQLTIDRWLRLAPDECLELERGEDIDVVSRWTASDDSADRLVEQIKHRDGSLTLNSAEARSAIANFIEHRKDNPSLCLKFRYVTTASVGIERSPHLLIRAAGVQVWEKLRLEAFAGAQLKRRLAAIRHVLRRAKRPDDCPASTWSLFENFFRRASVDEMRELVAGFEWSMNQPEPDDLRTQIESALVSAGVVNSAINAKAAYDHLFVRVFQILSGRGLKRLTRLDLDSTLASVADAPADARILARITDALTLVQQEIIEAKSRLDGHDQSIQIVQEQVATLAKANGMTSIVTALGIAPNVAKPPGPLARAARSGAVQLIKTHLSTHTWVAVYGMSGSGKSELVLQVAETFGGPVPWVSLRDLNARACAAQLIASLSAIAGSPPERDRMGWHARVCEQLAGSILVLDDLPLFEADGELGKELAHLALAFSTRDVRLLTTSAYNVPVRLTNALSVAGVPVPPFTNGEARALLVAFGATDGPDLEPWAAFTNASASGHAELLVTAAAFLRQREWRFSQTELQQLLTREYASEIQTDVVRRIGATVADESARELLYRASLITGSFSKGDLLALAATGTPISSPLTALASLEGLWIQAQGGDQFAVCPLAKGLEFQLDEPTQRNVHDTLGMQIMRRPSVGPAEVVDAITHFMGAQQFDRAGTAYLMALTSLDLDNLPSYDAGLFDLWATVPLPETIALPLRICIRTLQIAINETRNNDLDFLATNLLALADLVPAKEVSSLLPLIPRLRALADVDFDRSTSILVRLLTSQNDLVTPAGSPFKFPKDVKLASFLWHMAASVETADDVGNWLARLGELRRETLMDAAEGIAYELGVVGLTDGFWLREAKNSAEKQNWKSVLSLLEDIESQGRTLGLTLLVGASQRTQVAVLAEFEKQLDAAERVAGKAIQEAEGEPLVKFLVTECIGRQYLYAKRTHEAADALRVALASDSGSYEHIRFHAQLSLAESLADVSGEEALNATLEGVALALLPESRSCGSGRLVLRAS
ncbi:MAG: hypothetical protein WDO69_01235 [Pseudomonadota bacterium]